MHSEWPSMRLLAMKFAEFKKAGHWPTLLAAFLYFDISFMAWVALGPLMIYIARDMNLPVNEKLALVIVATAWVWHFGLPTKDAIIVFGLVLGIGGASFAVALPQASRWYPPQY